MHIAYKLTAKDLIEANRLHLSRGASSSIRMGRRMALGIGILILAITLAALAFAPSTAQLTRSIPALFFGLLLVFLTTLAVPLIVKRSFLKDKRLHDEFAAEITESGIEILSPNSRGQMDWSVFLRYFETKNLFLLYQSPQLFNVFPKCAFTPEQIDEFRSMLARKIILQ